MHANRERALKLRFQGNSYTQISRILHIPKSTLSSWFNGLDIPDKAQEKINARVYKKSTSGLLKRNKNQTRLAQQRAHGIKIQSARELSPPSDAELLFIGVALYWAEGYKRPLMRNGKIITSHSVRLTNSDPGIVKIYLAFLRRICKVSEEKISASIRIFEHHNEANLINFWSSITKIPLMQFGRSYYGISKSSLGKRPFNILPYGTIQITVNSTELYHRIMGWIEGLGRHFN